MSIRAHRVIEVKLADYSSFILGQDKELIQFLDEKIDFSDYLNEVGSGMVEVPVSVLKQALKTASKLNLGDDTVKSLNQDIEAAHSKKEKTVIYECF